jgi:transcriptional antiterminator NusG
MGLTGAEACADASSRWFALTVKPQHEKAVRQRLHSYRFETYLPLYRVKRQWSDREKTIELPLFPRYVFCRFSFEQRLTILRLPSVVSIAGFGGVPTPLDQQALELIRDLSESGISATPWPVVREGDRVRIRGGPLSGREGILLREKAGYRLVVSIEMLQRAVAVEIDREFLEPLEAKSVIKPHPLGDREFPFPTSHGRHGKAG